MKKLFLALLLSILPCLAFAQETYFKYEGNGYRLYNSRTGRWMSNESYKDYRNMGPYAGTYYYGVYKSNLWGIMDETGKLTVNYRFEDIGGGLAENGFLRVKNNGSWGLADVFGHIIIGCRYKYGYLYSSCVKFFDWKDNKEYTWRMDQLVAMRDNIIKDEKAREELAAKAAEEKAERERKEKELASFTQYAKAYVEPLINKWQLKGEFEKLSDYQKRVTGPNRSAMIDSLTRVAETRFIEEHTALKHETRPMKLDLYDSENEVFFIESPILGKMIVPVPIADGPNFKSHFNNLEKRNPVYYIENDKIALAKLEFYDKAADKSYYYNNRQALNYNHYEINPDRYSFELVSVLTAKPAEAAAANQTARPQRPIISIIAPGNNTTYSSPLVRIRYQATVFDQSTPTLHVWVNGSETEFVTKSGKPKSKGVAANWEEIELTLPKDREHPCNIMLSITDGSGYSSENKTISLSYVGEMPKPKLHIFSVGISNYQSSTLSKLGYASKDAKDFVNTITSSDVSMYEEIVAPVILTDKDATKSNIEKGLSNLTKTVGQDDVVFLYFSGHGMLDGEDAYFMSVDASSEEPYTGVDFALIRKNMVKLKDKKCKVVIFMDACYSGAMFNAKSNIKNITFADNGIIGFYSSTASQTSAEFSSDGNGLFTKALIEGLKGKAKNKDGEITTFGLQKYISDVVNQKTGGKQSPIVENKLGDLVLYKIK